MALATVLGLQFLSFFSVGPERSIMASNQCFEDDVADEQVEAWVREGAGGVTISFLMPTITGQTLLFL